MASEMSTEQATYRGSDAGEDVTIPRAMGYPQELDRGLSRFSNFGFSFSIICILSGGVNSLAQATSGAGGIAIGVGWLVGCFISLTFAIAMSQLASAFPTAGGPYHWASILGNRGLGWVTAWLHLIGLITVLGAINVGTWFFFASAFGVQYSLTNQMFFLIFITLWQGIINCLRIKHVSQVIGFSTWLIIVGSVLIAIVCLSSAETWDFSRLFTFRNYSGDIGGGVWPQVSNVWAFLFSLSLPIYTMVGFDASAQLSEETLDATRSAPRAMVMSVVWAALLGYLFLSAFVLMLPDMDEAAKQGWDVFRWAFEQRVGAGLRLGVYVIILLAQFLCGLAMMASASRMLFAFARDGGLPPFKALADVNSIIRSPMPAISTVACLSVLFVWISMLIGQLYPIIMSATLLFLILAYAIPIAAGLLAWGTRWNRMGPWNLGRRLFSLFAVLSMVATALILVVGFQTPNDWALGITIGFFMVAAIVWSAFERRRFRGPPLAEIAPIVAASRVEDIERAGSPRRGSATSPLRQLRRAAGGAFNAAAAPAGRLWRYARSLVQPREERARAPSARPVLAAAVILIVPGALAWLVHEYVAGAYRIFDERMTTTAGSLDTVTALVWSHDRNGPLFVGTQSGRLIRIRRGENISEIQNIGPTTPGGSVPVGGIEVPSADRPLPFMRAGFFPAGQAVEQRFVLGNIAAARYLFAATSDGGGTIIAAGVKPSSGPNRPLSAPLEQWRYPSNGTPLKIGEIPGLEDVRAVAALPGTSFVVAGDGAGNVFAIDASQQVSSARPEQYLFKLGNHDAAIVQIAVAATPNENVGAVFVTYAEDGTVKAWFSGSTIGPAQDAKQAAQAVRASQCCTPVDVTYPGEFWARAGGSANWSRLFAMSDDGFYIAGLDTEGRLALLDRRTGTVVRSSNPVGDVTASFRPDHAELLVTETDGNMPSARLYSLSDLDNPTAAISANQSPGDTIAFDRSGSVVAIAYNGDRLAKTRLGSASNFWITNSLEPMSALAFSPDGSLIAVGFSSGKIELRNATNGAVVADIAPDRRSLRPEHILFSADGKRLLVSSGGGYRAYSVRSSRIIPTSSTDLAVMASDGTRGFVQDGIDIDISDPTDRSVGGKISSLFDGSTQIFMPRDLKTNRQGTVSALLTVDTINFFERQAPPPDIDWRSVATLSVPVPASDGLKLSADGSTLLLRGPDGTLHIASVEQDRITLAPPVMRPFPVDLDVSDAELGSDGSTVYAAMPNGDLELINLRWSSTPVKQTSPAPSLLNMNVEVTGTTILPGHGALIDHLSVSPDGAYVASASIDGRLRITNVARARRIAGLPLAALRAGPVPPAMQPETLFDSPYAFLDATLITRIQLGLRASGKTDIQPDGILGVRTRAAIREFQATNGLAQTGQADRALYSRMKEMGLLRPADATQPDPGGAAPPNIQQQTPTQSKS